MAIKIPFALMLDVIRHAMDRYPEECCGILAGREGVVRRVYKLTNINRDSKRYFMDSKEQFKVLYEIKRHKMEVICIYHSHPRSPAYPSQSDIEKAFYPNAAYLILSLQEEGSGQSPGLPQVGLFWIRDEEVEEDIVEVV